MIPSHKRLLSILRLLLLLIVGQAVLNAQTFRGGINGVVLDPSGAVVQGASVVVTDEQTGITHESKTTGSGNFVFTDLPLDRYTLTVTETGFSTEKIEHLQVSQGSIYSTQIHLLLASAGTDVMVSADLLSLDTTSTTQTNVLDSAITDAIPLDGRDFTQMVGATPGFAGYAIGGGGTGMGSLNGTRFDQLNWQIDGIDNNDFYANVPAVNQGGILGIPGVVMPIDAIDQFSVQTQGNAEAGRNPGGVINVGLKSGGNSFHGTAFYFNRNEAFAKASPFLAGDGEKKRNRNYNTGYSLGGPILKNKLFFFTALETQKFSIGQNGTATEPSYAYQALAKSVLAKYDIAVNSVGQNILDTFYPAYALTGAASANNFTSPIPQNGHSWNGIGKFDYAVNSRNNLSLRTFGGEGNQMAPNGSELAPYYEVGPIHVWNYALVLNSAITDRWSNQLLVGTNYFNQIFNDAEHDFDVAGTGLITGSSYITNAPKIRITGFDKVSVIAPSGRNDITGQLTDTVSYSVGSHSFRFGGEFRDGYVNVFNSGNSTGQFTFRGNQGPWAGDSNFSSSVLALADELAGKYSSATMAIGDARRWVYQNAVNFFAQDSWRLTQKLTINYGIRYDYQGPIHNSDKDLSTFIPTRGVVTLGNEVSNLYPRNWTNFAPRIALAYDLGHGTVIRAGYGIYYDQPIMAAFLRNVTSNNGAMGLEANPDTTHPLYTQSLSAGTLVSGVQVFNTSGKETCVVTTTNVSPCGVFAVSQDFRTPYVSNYNLNVEQAIGSKLIAQVGYLGNESRKLLGVRDINQASLQSTGSPSTTDQAYTQQASRPYFPKFPTYGNINEIGTFQTGNYNSLQATLKVKSYHGLSGQTSYTWAHTLDEGSSSRSSLAQDSFNIKGDYGNSDQDTRNAFVGIISYTLPTINGHFKPLLNGWQLNSMFTVHDGVPFSVYNGSDTSGTDEGMQRVNLIGNPFAGVSHKWNNTTKSETWINAAAFASPSNGAWGTMRRNQIYGPGYKDVDFSVFKETHITKKAAVQIRAEMFNIFNLRNFAPPDNILGDDAFGTLYDTIGDYSGAPGIGPGEPFSMQLGAKIIF